MAFIPKPLPCAKYHACREVYPDAFVIRYSYYESHAIGRENRFLQTLQCLFAGEFQRHNCARHFAAMSSVKPMPIVQ